MGYDFHITRRQDWIDDGDDITAAEWLAYVERDPELQLLPDQGPYFTRWHGKCEYEEPWFNWDSGQIYTKNPDRAIVDKMVAMARAFGAKVQGDDGETYARGEQIDEPPPPRPVQAPPTLAQRMANWLARFHPIQSLRFRLGMEEFRRGERLRDLWGNEHTVTRITREHSVRVLWTRRDDGREMGHWMPVRDHFTRVSKRR